MERTASLAASISYDSLMSQERPALPRFRLAFLPLFGIVAMLLVEGTGYLAFLLKYRQLPYPFATAQFYQEVHLYMADHPYLPYLATKGSSGGVEFNTWGDRGPELESPKRRVRLLCYGGSTTYDARWPWALQKMLGADKYEVVIAAQNGATSADTLVNFLLIHQDFQPDYVLALEGINDLESSYTPGFRPDYAHRRRKIGASAYPVFDRLPRWFNLSSAYVLLRWRIVGPRGDLRALFTRPGSYDFERGPFGLPTFERNLRTLNLLARSVGARLVLGTPPYHRAKAERRLGRAFADGWKKGLDAENAIVRRLAAGSSGILLADSARHVPVEDAYFQDFCHFTDEGGRLVAESFYDALKRAGAVR